MVRPCVCDYRHYYPEEEERLATMTGDMTVLRRREPLRLSDEEDCNGCYHAGSTTGEVGQEEDIVQRHRWATVIQTDWLRLKLLAFFSQGSRAGTTTGGRLDD